MFDYYKIIVVAIVFYILLILGCIPYSQRSEDDAAHQQTVSNQSVKTPVCKYYGYWDHLIAPDEFSGHVNVGKSFNAHSASKIIEQGLKAVVSISHILKKGDTEQQWRTKLRSQGRAIQKYDPSDVVYVLLQDEPWIHGFTKQEQELLVELAREIIGDEYKYGFTFSRAQVQFKDQPIPNNIDVSGINFYPFFEEQYNPDNTVKTKAEFNRELQRTLRIFREKSPHGTEFMLTGQAFYQEGRWAKPSSDVPQWYVEAIQPEGDVIGLLWWVWNSNRKNTGTKEMPVLFEAQKEAFEWMCGVEG